MCNSSFSTVLGSIRFFEDYPDILRILQFWGVDAWTGLHRLEADSVRVKEISGISRNKSGILHFLSILFLCNKFCVSPQGIPFYP